MKKALAFSQHSLPATGYRVIGYAGSSIDTTIGIARSLYPNHR